MTLVTTTITRQQYFQVIGLLTFAQHHKKIVDGCEEVLRQMLEPDEESGHSGDAIWQPYDADTLLKNIGITVDQEVVAT